MVQPPWGLQQGLLHCYTVDELVPRRRDRFRHNLRRKLFNHRYPSISSAHLVFTMRVLVSNTGNENLEEWYAISASALAGETITVTLSASGYSTASIFGISGANTASPFDVHTGLPASAKSECRNCPTNCWDFNQQRQRHDP